MCLRFFLGIIGSIVYCVCALISDYAILFAFYYAYYFGNVIDCTWFFVGVEDMKIPALKNTIAKLIATIGIFIAVKESDDLWKYILLLALSNLVGMIISYPQLKKYLYPLRPNFKSFPKHYVGALMLFLPSLVSTIYLQVDKVMIEWLTNDTAQISFYDQAEKIVLIPLTFITVLSNVMMPRIANEFSNNNKEKINELLTKACRASLFMAFPLMFGIAGISNCFIPWYLGDEFSATSTALMILAPIVLSNTLIGISGTQYFIATNQIKILLLSNSLAAVMNILVNALMIPKFGYIGAAVATLISNYTLVLVQYYVLSKQISIRKMFSNTLRYLIASMIMFVFVFGLNFICKPAPSVTVIQILLGAIVFFGIMFVIKDELTGEIVIQIKRRIKRHE
ncbi:polysaccharide biosynthesis protein [Marvinbryantia formatexigens DSM 14469]|uniref:Polysaccharide biosynthesis protein n=2 Tax=Marvinbryantia TaxID=248744 RepID=C6LKZ7_9FIRM|nr:polysaccharide biosynthesis protein [Marvinbryantia formatexigens DSM 14469]